VLITFCTSSMNRLWQARQTLPENLDVLRRTPHALALCDYNSSDGLEDYVRATFADDVRRGTLTYFRTTAPQRFHASKAKNLAHRLGLRHGADVLFNLDVDNFIGAATIPALVARFSTDPDLVLHQWSRTWGDGTFGRIALGSSQWRRLGGYDESLGEMAWQDADLLFRARAIGLRYWPARGGFPPPIQNSMIDKLANVGVQVTDEAAAKSRFRRLSQRNMIRTLSRPITWPVEEQERFAGQIDLDRSVTV
jgi:hypothetical protein